MQVKGHAMSVVVLLAYLGMGILFYISPLNFMDEDEEQWSATEAFYFAVVTMSTVGYGDLVPGTSGAKVFSHTSIHLSI